MTSDFFFPALQIYHSAVSAFAAVSAIMVMQAVGHDWPTAAFNQAVQWIQRAGLAGLSIAEFCSAMRLPYLPEIESVALLSAAAVNTCVLAVLLPTALLGRSRTRCLWHHG